MKEMLTNNNYYWLSNHYASEIINFLAKAWDQQLDLLPLIHLCNVISLGIDMQKNYFMTSVQIRLLTLKLEPFPKFKRDATMTQL